MPVSETIRGKRFSVAEQIAALGEKLTLENCSSLTSNHTGTMQCHAFGKQEALIFFRWSLKHDYRYKHDRCLRGSVVERNNNFGFDQEEIKRGRREN